MAIFSQQSPQRPDRPSEEPRKRTDSGTGFSIVGPGMSIVGDLSTDGVVKIEGRVQGSVKAAQQVLVAQGAVIEGDLETREAVVGGEVRGVIRATERVEIQGTCVVTGDIVTPRLTILEGGQVNGEIKMGDRGHAQADARIPKDAAATGPAPRKTVEEGQLSHIR